MKTICDGGLSALNLETDEVKYPYALIEDESVFHIREVNKENRRLHKYTCPECHQEFRPRLGAKRAHCYYHYLGNRCSMDKYIHNTAEKLLQQKFYSEEKFEVTMSVNSQCKKYKDCNFRNQTCATSEIKTFDLKKYYKDCLVEQKFGEFIPDLLLVPKDETKNDPIFIEIWHKHKTSDKKMNSGHKIIEIKIETLEELEQLPNGAITESDRVTFTNFDLALKDPKTMPGVKLLQYTLYDKGTFFCGDCKYEKCYHYTIKNYIPTTNLKIIGRESDFLYVPEFDGGQFTPRGWFRENASYLAVQKGYDPRSCYQCQHADECSASDGKEIIMRCRLKMDESGELAEVKHTVAAKCNDFLRKTVWNDYVAEFQKYKSLPLYIWQK